MTLKDIEDYKYQMRKKMAPIVFWATVFLSLESVTGIGITFYRGQYIATLFLLFPFFMTASCASIVRKWRKQNP